MTNDLLTKATALLEAREKLPHAESFGGVEIQEDFPRFRQPRGSKIYDDTSKYLELAANTAPEIITGFQLLLKEKDALIQTLEDENEMLTESNEHLMQCEGERNDLRRLLRRAEGVLSRLDQELGCNSAYLLSTREIVAQVVAEARAALPPEQHHATTPV